MVKLIFLSSETQGKKGRGGRTVNNQHVRRWQWPVQWPFETLFRFRDNFRATRLKWKTGAKMQGSRRMIGLPAVAVVLMFAAVMSPEVSALRYVVGGNMGWTPNVNYSNWARGKHFYKGDWLCMFSSLVSDLLFMDSSFRAF